MADTPALRLLNRLEDREYELLTWGFLDGGFIREEIEDAAADICEEIEQESGDSVDAQELLDELDERRLLFELNIDGCDLYRTRFAEAVRLFARLRQIFKVDGWSMAPQLVADYRVAIRPRRYPRRDVTPDQVRASIERAIAPRALSPLEKSALQALTQRAGKAILLSRFQVQAAEQLLRTDAVGHSRGTIVCAGTGTGKTISFYLPALLHIARHMAADAAWTQALAIYPRNELLKDQFTEAYGQARRLDAVVKRSKGRIIRIGAFFGPTPYNATVQSVEWAWPKTNGGYVCPFLRCPVCDGELMWKTADIEAGKERLRCTKSTCSGATQEDEVLLTRRRMEEGAPDILFTTTEMLNRSMGASRLRPLFGIGCTREHSVQFVLLDEVHTYGGVHGAQVALLLRRWRCAARHPAHFVGLSATLSDPQNFFAQLTGLHPGGVLPVAPGDGMEEEGREYQLVLRGDPVSGTSLLSTSIQAAMLLGRVLDPPKDGMSADVFARKTFVFTDDLDVTNRLYHNLLDAEGRDSRGRPKSEKQPLAALRSSHSHHGDPAERMLDGQNWRLCERIGHPLDGSGNRLAIGRTSSQDVGVDNASQIIVATASLEVGYNDPSVGAVMQHKAPRDAASFLQRKGRAGRQRITRPWTVVTLSDYGRDRLAYQGYDQLFDPVLEKPALPTDNRYVLRIQATYALMDWIAAQMPARPQGSVWTDFSRPARNEYEASRQQWQAGFIHHLLESNEKREKLATYLSYALRIKNTEVQALLWEPPRSLMTAVLPTLWRRLTFGWRQVPTLPGETEQETTPAAAPLPEFVPENLFSDLNVPEVLIWASRGAPPGQPTPDPKGHWMGLTPTLRALAPGRVTRRFAVSHIADNHWMEPPALHDGTHPTSIEHLCEDWEEVGMFEAEIEGQISQVRCVRPHVMCLSLVPAQVKNTSNAFLDWRSQFLPPLRGERNEAPQGSLFNEWIQGVTFYTHNGRNPLRVRRFAVASDASLRFQGGGEAALHLPFVDESGLPAALGFEHEVDGLAFHLTLPPELTEQVKSSSLPMLRAAYFRDSVEKDATLLAHANSFRLGWMSQIFGSVLLTKTLVSQCTLEEAAAHYAQADWMPSIERAMDVIFGVLNVSDTDEEGGNGADDDAPPHQGSRPKLYLALRDLAQVAEVRTRLLDLARSLWEAPGAAWDEWLRNRLKATLGGALLQACYALTPQFQAGDLLLDLDSGVPAADAEATLPQDEDVIWISEDTTGGGGVVEEIMRQYIEDPRRFFLLVETALGASDFEIVDAQLTHVVELSQTDTEVQSVFSQVRHANGNDELTQARRDLMTSLLARNVLVTHPVMTSLNARILRAGSSPHSDALLADLLARWNAEEVRLGIEIDARIFAYLVAVSPDFEARIREVLHGVGGDHITERKRRYSVLYGLLWPRGAVLRERALDSYNPYAAAPRGDASLLRAVLRGKRQPVSIHEADWWIRAQTQLAETGVVQLIAANNSPGQLRDEVLAMVGQPIEAGFLRLFPHLARLESTLDGYSATLHLREAVQ